MLKDEQNIIEKRMTSIKARKYAHFDELVNFIIGPKVIVIELFIFLRSDIFFIFFGDLVRVLFGLIYRK